MNRTQRARIAALKDKMVDVVIRDADPDNWVAPGIKLSEMSKEERGDAAWCRKTAMSSVSLLINLERLEQVTTAPLSGVDEEDVDAGIKRAEKAAAALLKRTLEKSRTP